MTWDALSDLIGRELVEQARACPVPVCELVDLDQLRTYRHDQDGGIQWMRTLPIDRLAGLLRLLMGEVRADLTRAWEAHDNAH